MSHEYYSAAHYNKNRGLDAQALPTKSALNDTIDRADKKMPKLQKAMNKLDEPEAKLDEKIAQQDEFVQRMQQELDGLKGQKAAIQKQRSSYATEQMYHKREKHKAEMLLDRLERGEYKPVEYIELTDAQIDKARKEGRPVSSLYGEQGDIHIRQGSLPSVRDSYYRPLP